MACSFLVYSLAYIHTHACISSPPLCSADGSTHTESNKLYRKVKHRSPPKSILTPTAKARPVRRRSRRLQGRRAPHTEHGLGVFLAHTSFQHWQHSLNTFHTHTAASMKRDRRKSLFETNPLLKNGHAILLDEVRWSQTVNIQRAHAHTRTGNWSESGGESLMGAPLDGYI